MHFVGHWEGEGKSSVIKYLPSMCRALSSIQSTIKKKKEDDALWA